MGLVRLPSNLRHQGTVAQGAPAKALDDLRAFECQSSRRAISSRPPGRHTGGQLRLGARRLECEQGIAPFISSQQFPIAFYRRSFGLFKLDPT